MKTPEDLFLSEQVNLAHMLSMAGMIREHMSARQADIFRQQIYLQTAHLIPNEESTRSKRIGTPPKPLTNFRQTHTTRA